MSSLAVPVLVLNKGYQAVQVVPASQALSDLWAGKVQALDEDYNLYNFADWSALSAQRAKFEPDRHCWIQAVRQILAIPPIVRLLQYNRQHVRKARLSRRNLYVRDRNTCQYCGRKFRTSDLNLDHVVPKCQGGQTTWRNVVCSCIACNTRKGSHTPEQAGMRLIRVPQTPRQTVSPVPIRHPSWEAFVDAAYWNVELEN